MISENDQQDGLKAWQPESSCVAVPYKQSRLSAGFLRSTPAAWFPGLAAQWLPFQHSSSVEFQVLEVKPVLSLVAASFDHDLQATAGWSVDDESFVLYSTARSRDLLANAVAPDQKPRVKPILVDYLARRLVISLLNSWSGFDLNKLTYEAEMNLSAFHPEAYIVLKLNINSEKAAFGFGLSKGLVNGLDGLWRRQIKASRRSAYADRYSSKNSLDFKIELARLSLAPNAISNYLQSGSMIDLEIPVSDKAILRNNDDPWISVQLRNVEGQFGLEVNSLSPVLPQAAPGTTALSIELGQVTLSNSDLIEYEQPGANIQSGLPLSNIVNLSIRGERVAAAQLLNYQGRWALKVL